jgi:hypothetical protein
MATSGATVTVASKDPLRLTLNLNIKTEHYEPVLGGGTRKVELWRPTSRTVVLNGTGVMHGEARNHPMAHGYALTPGVPLDFWNEWCEQNKGCALLEKNIIFARPKTFDVSDKAREYKSVRTGLEPIDPKAKTRMGNGFEIVTSEDQPKIEEQEPLEDITS